MTNKTTTGVLFVKTPQYVVEATEGTTPTASPSFTAFGAVDSLSLKVNNNFVDVSQLGAEDLITIIQGMNSYETNLKMTVLNSTVVKRAVNAANYGTPTGTVSETFTLLFSIYLNGTENFILCKGSRIKDVSFTRDVGRADEWSINLIHTTITTPSSSSGLTTPTYASTPSGTVWGWLDGGANPVSWNAAGIDAKRISLTVNRNTDADYILGATDPTSTQTHGRRIGGDFTVLWSSTTIEADYKAGTARSLAIVVKSATSTITVSNALITDYSRDSGSDDSGAILESCSFKAPTITMT